MVFNPRSGVVCFLEDLSEGKQAIGYEDLTFDGTVAVGFASIPTDATVAVIVLDANAGFLGLPKLGRFKEDGSLPTISSGLPIGDNDVYEVKHIDNINNFRIIGADGFNATHTLRVQYYMKAD